MNRLIRAELLYDGLVSLDTPELVRRYNATLGFAGIEPERVSNLHIDGIGWSPEIAEKKRNPLYLCHDLANPLAIIVTPEQFKKPVYYPLYSWMRRIMRSVFDGNFREISDITATHGIVLDFENHLQSLESPADLLLLSSITPIPNTGELSQAAVEQKKLVSTFLEGTNCLEPELRQKLRESAETHGDLRRRRVVLEHLPVFTDFQDFYTVAFDGVAVFRGVSGKDVLVVENESFYEGVSSLEDARSYYLYASDYAPFRLFLNAGWITVPSRYRDDPELLNEKSELLLASCLLDLEKSVEWDSLTSGQKKQLAIKHKEKIPAVYWELDRFIAALAAKKKVSELSDELTVFLAEPSSNLHPSTQDVLWMLLIRREPRNLLELYTHDKNFFLKCYKEFGKNKRAWVAGYLSARYVKRMRQP